MWERVATRSVFDDGHLVRSSKMHVGFDRVLMDVVWVQDKVFSDSPAVQPVNGCADTDTTWRKDFSLVFLLQ